MVPEKTLEELRKDVKDLCENKELFNKAVVEEDDREELYNAWKEKKDLERILTIDLKLGYIKDDDRDRVDYFNSLPTACKLSFYNQHIKKGLANSALMPRVSEENRKSLK